jgi:hypothetical protein
MHHKNFIMWHNRNQGLFEDFPVVGQLQKEASAIDRESEEMRTFGGLGSLKCLDV